MRHRWCYVGKNSLSLPPGVIDLPVECLCSKKSHNRMHSLPRNDWSLSATPQKWHVAPTPLPRPPSRTCGRASLISTFGQLCSQSSGSQQVVRAGPQPCLVRHYQVHSKALTRLVVSLRRRSPRLINTHSLPHLASLCIY